MKHKKVDVFWHIDYLQETGLTDIFDVLQDLQMEQARSVIV